MVTTHFMDEAEHCDEIGFIFEGNLIASDTPDNLKKIIPGTLVEIPTPSPMELLETLEESTVEYLDIYPAGASVHVLLKSDDVSLLAGYAYEIISPSLEDVFVYLVKSYRRELVS